MGQAALEDSLGEAFAFAWLIVEGKLMKRLENIMVTFDAPGPNDHSVQSLTARFIGFRVRLEQYRFKLRKGFALKSNVHSCVRVALVTIVSSAWVTSGVAADIPPDCLASFDVKDNTFSSENSTVSCQALETRRADLFNRINLLPVQETVSGEDLAAELAKLEQTLREMEEDSNWTGWAIALSGNTLATIGLGACLETAGAGCAAAAIVKILSIADIIHNASDSAQQKAASAQVRAEIQAIRAKLGGKQASGAQLRARLVTEFTGLCETVQAQCL